VEQAGHWFREKYEEDSDYPEKGDIVESSAPHGFLQRARMPGPRFCPTSVAAACSGPRRQEHKNDHADGDRVPGEGSRTKMLTMRTRPIQLVCAMANCRMPVSDTRSTAATRRTAPESGSQMRMRSVPRSKR